MTEPLAAEAFVAPVEVGPPTGRYVLRYGQVRTGRLLGRIDATAARGYAGMLGDGYASVTVRAAQAREVVRVSFGPQTAEQEVDAFAASWEQLAERKRAA